MNRMGSLHQSSSDMALGQVKANRAQIDAMVGKWGLDKPLEAERQANVLDMDPWELTMDNLRGQQVATLNQVLKRCTKGSREYKMVKVCIDKAGSSLVEGEIVLKDGKKLDSSYAKYMDMAPGAVNLSMKALEKNLKKLQKGKKNKAGIQQLEATRKQLETVGLIFADKVQYSGLLMKKGGEKGTKGIAERWFALENVDGDHWVLEYYHPKKFTMLGEIPIDNKCVIAKADRDEKGLGPMFHLEVTCTHQSRTYYMLTAEQEQRDEWFRLICEDAGVQGMGGDDSADDEMADDNDDDDHPEEMDDDGGGGGEEVPAPEVAEEEETAPEVATPAPKKKKEKKGKKEEVAEVPRVQEEPAPAPAVEEEDLDDEDLE